MRNIIQKIVICSALLMSSIVVKADVFDEVVREIVNNNYSLKASRETANSELENLKAENNLSDPEVEFEHLWGPANAGNRWNLGVSQSFEWPGIYGARKRVIKATSDAMEYISAKERFDMSLEVSTALIDMVYYRQNKELMTSIIENIDSLLLKTRKGASMGEVSILDVNMLEVEKLNASKRLEEIQVSLASVYASLKILNGGKDCITILNRVGSKYPERVILSDAEYYDLAMKNDPDIAVASAISEAAREKLRMSKFGNYPGFSVGYVHSYEDQTHFNGFSVGMTLPFFSNRHKKKAAEAELRAAEFSGIEKTATKKVALSSDREEAVALQKIVNRYASVLEKTDNLKLLRKAYDGGQINIYDYLQRLNFFLEAKFSYYETLYNYNLVLVRLNRYK